MSRVLLTGATGLLGRYLLSELLAAGEQVAVLVRRARDGSPPSHRIDAVLRHFESSLGRTLPRPRVLEGSLLEEHVGLSADDRRWLRQNCTSVIHGAASLRFQYDELDDEPYASNVDGTRLLLALCAEHGIREFHHISTAYVCGERTGRIFEHEFDEGQNFRNDYECSKFTAERIVREATHLDSVTFYRPSIIVGDSRSGYTSTFHGFYLPLQLAVSLSKAGFVPPSVETYREALGVSGDARKNLVPVDWVSAMMVRIFRDKKLHACTYHLTNPIPATAEEMESAIASAVERSVGVRTEKAKVLTSEQTEQFRREMAVYAGYFKHDPDFDCTNTNRIAGKDTCPQLTRESLMQLADFAIQSNFGWPKPRPPLPVLDVETLLRHFEEKKSAENFSHVVQLEVSGSLGGTWRFGIDRQTAFLIDTQSPTHFAYCNVHVLRALLAGEVELKEAIRQGAVALCAQNGNCSMGPELLDILIGRLRDFQ